MLFRSRVTSFCSLRGYTVLRVLKEYGDKHGAVSYTHLDVYKRQVIYCVQSIVIALLLVNVVRELHSTIRVKSLWIFFSQVSNFIMQSTSFSIIMPKPKSRKSAKAHRTIFLPFLLPFPAVSCET